MPGLAPLKLLLALALGGALSLAAAGPSPAPPGLLSKTGLYADMATKRVDPKNLSYSPQYPLWSDGAHKRRWVYLPAGRRIDAARQDDWVFPVGTRFWKEFTFDTRVETRYIEKVRPGAWRFATYVWNADESDALLAPERGLKNNHDLGDGIRHDIPGVLDCRTCHEGQGSEVILGFSALQLSPDRDAMAPHAETLEPGMITLTTLVSQNRIAAASPTWRDTPPRIAAETPRARAALGYLHGNCGGCHRAGDTLASVGMFLRHSLATTTADDEPGMVTTSGAPSKYAVPGVVGEPTYRIKAGDPDRSALVFRMSSRNPLTQMPPLGTKLVDRDALALIKQWIRDDLK